MDSSMIAPLDFLNDPSPSAASSPQCLRTTVTEGSKERSSAGFLAIKTNADSNEVKFQGPEAWLHVYDLNGTKGANNKLQPLGLGLFHAGLEIYGVEWSFGGTLLRPGEPPVTGIHPMQPRSCPGAIYRESSSLGAIPLTAEEVWQILVGLAAGWLGTSYHPLKRNCLNFCSEFSIALQLQDVPGWVGRLAVAADYVLSPVLGVLDTFHLLKYLDVPGEPVSSQEESRGHRLAVTSEAQCDVVWDVALQGERASALERAVVHDFVEQFGWANGQMMAEYVLWEEQMEQKRSQSLLEFL